MESHGHIRNPLTIIGIFAGIAEVSGASIVTHLVSEQQAVFVWFLMLFPVVLVLLFFLTLWFKPAALYAPSDFDDEGNFMMIHEKYDRIKQKTVQVVEQKQVRSEEDFNLLGSEDFEKKSYTIAMSQFSRAGDFVRKLKEKGYTAGVYRAPGNTSETTSEEDHEAIWLGKNVPGPMAIDIIKDAINFYPHLKYIHISSDNKYGPPEYIHNQIYIGGSSQSAKEYMIKEFQKDEILSLKPDTEIKELHAFIRKYY